MKFVVKWETDESPDLSHLGSFSGRQETGAIRRENVDRGQLPWFVPGTSAQEHYEGLITSTRQRSGQLYTEKGARRLAAQYVLADLHRLETYGNHWWMVGCIVTFKTDAGIVLGAASLGGIESDSDKAYKAEIIRDLKAEAYGQSKNTLKNLLALTLDFPALDTIEVVVDDA